MSTNLDPWYVTGLLESAGSFTFQRSRGHVTVVFVCRARSAGRPLLAALQAFFKGAGRIYRVERRGPAQRASESSWLYRINRPHELVRLIEHFDAFPLHGERRATYTVWRELVWLRAALHGTRSTAELVRLTEALSRAAAKERGLDSPRRRS